MKNNIQVNYTQSTSNTNNYNTFESSSSPESFSKMVGNGVFVEYKQTRFSTNFIENSEINKQPLEIIKNT